MWDQEPRSAAIAARRATARAARSVEDAVSGEARTKAGRSLRTAERNAKLAEGSARRGDKKGANTHRAAACRAAARAKALAAGQPTQEARNRWGR